MSAYDQLYSNYCVLFKKLPRLLFYRSQNQNIKKLVHYQYRKWGLTFRAQTLHQIETLFLFDKGILDVAFYIYE